MNYQSSAKIPLWQPAMALLSEHRGLVRSMVRRDLSSRYKGSIIGPAWAIITPAVMIIIFTAIFSGIFGARFGAQGGHLSFAIYLFCGLLPWIAFSDGVQRSTTSLTDNVNLVKRVVFPTEALPVNLALSGIAQQLIGTVVLLAVRSDSRTHDSSDRAVTAVASCAAIPRDRRPGMVDGEPRRLHPRYAADQPTHSDRLDVSDADLLSGKQHPAKVSMDGQPEPDGPARSQLPPNIAGGKGAGLARAGRDDGFRAGLFRLRLLVVSKDEEGFR